MSTEKSRSLTKYYLKAPRGGKFRFVPFDNRYDRRSRSMSSKSDRFVRRPIESRIETLPKWRCSRCSTTLRVFRTKARPVEKSIVSSRLHRRFIPVPPRLSAYPIRTRNVPYVLLRTRYDGRSDTFFFERRFRTRKKNTDAAAAAPSRLY